MRKRRFVSAPKYFNCYFTILILFLKGRLKRAMLKKTPGKFIPHMIGELKSGNYVHFKTVDDKQLFYPIWFEGRIEVMKKRKLY